MRTLTPNTLVGLMALCIPPVEGTSEKNPVTEYRAPHFRVRCIRCVREITSFDLERFADLLNQYVAMPGAPHV